MEPSSSKSHEFADDGIALELRKYKLTYIIYAICFLVILAVIVIVPRMSSAKAAKPTEQSFINIVSNKGNVATVKSRHDTTLVIDLISYREAGYMCMAGYSGEVRMSPVQYCEHWGIPSGFWYLFRSYDKRFGKYFVGNSTSCYVVDEFEENPGIRPDTGPFAWLHIKKEEIFLLSVRGDSRFIYSSNYTTSCRAAKHRHIKALPVASSTGEEISIQDFVIGRAVVWSTECKQMQLIPALYSLEAKKCLYGSGVGKPFQVTSDCHVMCLAETS